MPILNKFQANITGIFVSPMTILCSQPTYLTLAYHFIYIGLQPTARYFYRAKIYV